MIMALSPSQKIRYDRNLLLRGFSEATQEILLSSRVLVIGAGGLGSTALLYLASAGIGTIGIVDDDIVEVSNLQRQIIHDTTKLGILKTSSAKEQISCLDPDINVIEYPTRLDERNVVELIEAYDFILDCSDNLKTKTLINETCVKLNKPYTHAGITGMKGQVMTYLPEHACLSCAFDLSGSIPTVKELGILGAYAGALGSIQAGEAIKYLSQIGKPIIDGYLLMDFGKNHYKLVPVKKDKHCPICSK
jgi:adenylyltransferase/sulfurtransferase